MSPLASYSRRTLLKLLLGLGAMLTGWELTKSGVLSPSLAGGDSLASFREAASRPTVALVRGGDPAAMVRAAVTLAGGLEPIVRGKDNVLIKPNLTIPSASGSGNVTDSRVLRAVIELCREAGAKRVAVADGSGGGDSFDIMRQAGYEDVLKATGTQFVDLNRDEVVYRRLADFDGMPEYALAKSAAEAAVLISVAVLKTHVSANVTLTCKNLIGIAARQVYGRPRQRLHDAGVQRVTADLVRLKPPDFAIVDGVVGLEGESPMRGTPVPMNIIIAGRSAVSVDAVVAAVMDFEPQRIEQLSLLSKRGAGVIDLAQIELRGVPLSDVRRHFRR